MPETLLNSEVTRQIQVAFQQLDRPVEVLFFSKPDDCDYCAEAGQLAQEVVALDDRLSLSTYNLEADQAVASRFKVTDAPTLVITGKEGNGQAGEQAGDLKDYGIRLMGIPMGHEFSSFIHDLILVSRRDSGLSPQTRDFLKSLTKPVLLQVFVTPTCPYCPQAVVLAHRMALESPLVEAEMIEATEFPDLADRFSVSGVPQTTINTGAGTLVGAAPEDHLVEEIRRALVG